MLRIHMRRLALVMIICALVLMTAPTAAQDTTVTVPDVTGLSVPQAAAALNRAGIRLGAQFETEMTEGTAPNTVVVQSVAAGATVARGSSVDVTVARGDNAILIYDDNDITLVNQSGGTISLAGITFNALDANRPVAFNATRWPAGALDAGECAQLWSIGRRDPKRIPECGGSIFWLTTNDTNQHFWTGAGGATRFNLVQDGLERAQCNVSMTGSCPLYLSSSAAPEATDFVYLAYTADRLIIYNLTQDLWMPLQGLSITDSSGRGNPLTSPAAFGNPDIIGNMEQLAPGQCLFYRTGNASENLPQPCDVIFEMYTNVVEYLFNAEAFTVVSPFSGQRYNCPAATPDWLTVCIVPR